MGSLSTSPKTHFPITLEFGRKPSHSASFDDFEALLLLRVRSQPPQISPQRLADTLLAFCPSRAQPTTPRVLHPPGPHGPRTTHPPAAG